MYLEPPSCSVDVYANQRDGTANICHYKVPVLGVEERVDIYINLSLTQQYNSCKKKQLRL